MSAQSSIRIIGGKWRSRKVHFADKEGLRPTPDRVRETLFNWLAPYIVEALCIDLFAGSGVLSFEALSRGAKAVRAIEQDRENVTNINKNKDVFRADQLQVINQDVIAWLQTKAAPADIIFADPPYKEKLLFSALNLLEEHGWVHAQSLIYFEQDEALDPKLLPTGWQIWRESKAGRVYYYLANKEQ